jgi:type IV pilus assembly protein PilY1
MPSAPAGWLKRWGATRAAATGLVLALPLAALPQSTDLSNVPLPTFTVGSTVDIKPNILMVLDDSGSMMWNWLPDWAGLGSTLGYQANYKQYVTMFSFWQVGAPPYLFTNAAFNGVAYNPAVTYLPPVTFTASGTKDTTTYPVMTGMSAAAGADTSKSLPNWGRVKNDAYGVQDTGTTNLNFTASSGNVYDLANTASSASSSLSPNSGFPGAFFYTVIPGEYCDSPALTNCSTTSTPSGNFQYPAPLRWCNSAALTTCRALPDATYIYPRIPAPRLATITFPSTGTGTVTGITVANPATGSPLQILAASTGSQSGGSALASAVAAQINKCTYASTSSCTTIGFLASSSGSTVRIYAPDARSDTPSLAITGVTATPSAFARSPIPLPDYLSGTTTSSAAIPGENVRITIAPSITSYPYPGSTTKAPTRTDCAGSTCTYAEEMTNYANWWTYFRTRMMMMKSATARAFSTLDTDTDIAANASRFRVGYFSINNNTGSDFVNITDFDATQKFTWYSKFLAANPNNSTPLRQALANAGRLYGGMLTGSSFNGSTVTDPMQFSCQRNYTILSTDGFWNGNAGYKLDGRTAVGNQDGILPRPYNDGASQQTQTRTSQLQQRTDTQNAQLGTLQQQVSQLQITVFHLQQRTSTDGGKTFGAWSNVSSCTADNSGSTRTQCQYAQDSTVDATSCTTINKSTSSPFTVATAQSCSFRIATPYANAASCSPSSTPDANGQTVQCQYAFATSAPTATCAPAFVAGNFGNATVYANCSTTTGNLLNVSSCTATSTPNDQGQTTACQYTAWSSWSNVISCSAVPQSTGPNFTVSLARQCQVIASGGTSDTLADVAAYYYYTDLRNAAQTGADATGTCTGPTMSPATTANDLCANNVIPAGRDTAVWQHMTVHTLGLGAQGMMVFSPYQNNLAGQRVFVPDYFSQPSGDFYSVANGSTASPSTGICPWMSNGSTCTWSTPAADSIANIDDLWHAAVNGHGTYFSASDPSSLSGALSGVLSQIVHTPRPGTAAAAASSNPNITSSDNFVFSSSYRSIDWFGELIMQRFNPDGSLTAQQWSAMQQLDCDTTPWQANFTYAAGQVYSQGANCFVVNTAYTSGTTFAGGSGLDGGNTTALTATPATRTIYTVAATGGLIPFQWSSLSATQQAYFSTPYINYVSSSQGLSQFCSTGGACLSGPAQVSASGEALVNFLRGDRTNEGTFYRSRVHVLGDIVSSEARYVKQPLQQYLHAGYSAFAAAKASRPPTVYVGSNDGMLHAFDALTGQERWGFVPSAVLPAMYKLADMNYTNQHQYFVDGTPEVGDICPLAPSSTCGASDWKTVIVGGLNEGGKSFYALDITDPTNPRLLWEFTDANLGLTYGNPRITKLANGTWVVIVASGYNNGDGLGHLFVLNANSGAKLNDIQTTAGTASNPSGLAKIAARAPTGATNNTVEEVYGGDLLGNVWRFDVNGTIGAAGTDAQLLINLQDANGLGQPITAKPLVASVNNLPLVIVGTGKYLGLSDLTDTRIYSMYAIKDTLGATTLTTPRASGSNFVRQTLNTGTCPSGESTDICSPGQSVITASSNPVDWSTKNGWYLDFLNPGERSVTDPTLALGTLVFTTIKPQPNTVGAIASCSSQDQAQNAESFVYFLDYLTGGAVNGAKDVIGELLCDCVATRPSLVKTEQTGLEAVIRTSGGGNCPSGTQSTDMGCTTPFKPPTDTGSTPMRRISWRELNG